MGLASVRSSARSVRPKSSAKNSRVSLRSAEKRRAEEAAAIESDQSGAYDTAGNYVRYSQSGLSMREDGKLVVWVVSRSVRQLLVYQCQLYVDGDR